MSESNGHKSVRGRVQEISTRFNAAIDSANETSKRVQETAGWVTVALACVAVVSIAALGLAVIALIGNSGCKAADE